MCQQRLREMNTKAPEKEEAKLKVDGSEVEDIIVIDLAYKNGNHLKFSQRAAN